MKIQTKYIGSVEVDQNETIEFPQGIPGFNAEREFILLDFPENPVFQIMQSVENQQLAFIVTNPFHFRSDYDIDLDRSLVETLEIQQEGDVVILSILSLKDPFEKSTMNLQAPIVVNMTKRKGKQFITNKKDYSTREPLIAAASSKEKED
ncbi:flagellar assembly protein FliW [Sediminibacillus dalangtanensis]|uniref:Flagellar assembly factor FliW n=1 Tax=Sediminibacillus dalangtanensis TaxID=2729421 RepID=A0ABX7W0G7_9BACI|nr:flagellar assembly protein FliW [Sediminibacillus dalangtanensis]QTN00393.1 flagellar assembly protein FliW [Sediminibacillus dalangtanensis]